MLSAGPSGSIYARGDAADACSHNEPASVLARPGVIRDDPRMQLAWLVAEQSAGRGLGVARQTQVCSQQIAAAQRDDAQGCSRANQHEAVQDLVDCAVTAASHDAAEAMDPGS